MASRKKTQPSEAANEMPIAPVTLIQKDESGDRFLVYRNGADARVDLLVQRGTFWATQSQMAEMFGILVPGISKHLKNIFASGELSEAAVVSIKEITAADGKPYKTKIYNLNALISVGYRVESVQGTLFRIWATDKLVQYLVKGFVIDDERLKNPNGPDYFDELVERLRDIRSSESRMWMRVLEFAELCSDYDPNDENQRIAFFAEIQNTMHWAVVQMTAAEMVKERVHADKPNAGVITFKGKMPTVKEAGCAKNLHGESEITALNHITSLLLEFFDSQVEQRKLTTLDQFVSKMRDLVKLDGRPLKEKGYTGTVSRDAAEKWASDQVREFKVRQREQKEIAGEQAVLALVSRVNAAKPTRRRTKKAG